jgi:hypothetical protein
MRHAAVRASGLSSGEELLETSAGSEKAGVLGRDLVMPCSWVKLPGGGTAIVKHAKARSPKCRFCPRSSTKLCDAVIGKTLGGGAILCDAPICDSCARPFGPGQDLCPNHSK